MVLTAQDIQLRVLSLVGDLDLHTLEPLARPYGNGYAGTTNVFELGLCGTQIASFWARHADKAGVPGLQELYVRLDCLDVLLGELSVRTDYSMLNYTYREGQQYEHRRQLREETLVAIQDLEKRSSVVRTPVSGQPTTTAPQSPPSADWPDANSGLFSGSPYYRGFR